MFTTQKKKVIIMNRLFIIGNGFDLAHGLHTKYQNFKAFLLNEDEGEMVSNMEACIDEHYLWNHWEEALGDLDVEEFYSNHSCYFYDGQDEWSDKYNHTFTQETTRTLSFSRELDVYLRKWINSTDLNVLPIFPSKLISKDAVYMTFNYTKTLETIYNIPNSQVIHIHGIAEDETDKLVFGHNSEYKPITILEGEDNEGQLKEVGEYVVKPYFENTTKNVDSVLIKYASFFNTLSQITKVIVLGHSLSKIDLPYFMEVKEKTSPICEWYISYYDEGDKILKQMVIQMLRLNNAKLFKMDGSINEKDIERILSPHMT